MLENGPLPGQLEVIGKLDALAKSLRSSEAWKCLFVFLVGIIPGGLPSLKLT